MYNNTNEGDDDGLGPRGFRGHWMFEWHQKASHKINLAEILQKLVWHITHMRQEYIMQTNATITELINIQDPEYNALVCFMKILVNSSAVSCRPWKFGFPKYAQFLYCAFFFRLESAYFMAKICQIVNI